MALECSLCSCFFVANFVGDGVVLGCVFGVGVRVAVGRRFAGEAWDVNLAPFSQGWCGS